MSRLKELQKYVDAELNKMEDADKNTSKFISLILRHKPETIGIKGIPSRLMWSWSRWNLQRYSFMELQRSMKRQSTGKD